MFDKLKKTVAGFFSNEDEDEDRMLAVYDSSYTTCKHIVYETNLIKIISIDNLTFYRHCSQDLFVRHCHSYDRYYCCNKQDIINDLLIRNDIRNVKKHFPLEFEKLVIKK